MTAVWRIARCPPPVPAGEALQATLATLGVGSTLGNGRWHTRGPMPVVYAASSRALCQLEKRVHCNGAQPKHQALMRLALPDDAPLLDVRNLDLPVDWRSDEAATQAIGMAWLVSVASLGLWVPSFVEPNEANLLLHPAHPGYAAIRLSIERWPFQFDPRMF